MSYERELEYLRQMMRVRAFEDAWGEAYRNAEIEGIPPALGTGQEAVSVGACAALEPGDFVFTTHRGQAAQVARGLDAKRMMAELYCRRTGYNKGKSYHITDVEAGVIGMGGIVGAQVPVAAGVALARQLQGSDRVSLAFFGDGAANEGVVQESASLAAMWTLPLILLCEHNGWCISQPAGDAIKGEGLMGRARAWGLAGTSVDGNDPEAVHEAVAEAVARARGGEGATLVEARTLRLGGHLAHDPQTYRDPDELAAGWNDCPIKRLSAALMAAGALDAAGLADLEGEIAAEMEAAVAFARQSPPPAPEEAFNDLWAGEQAHV
ncbi:MAG: thiamine pyrophosphate-dependent dehydrogenase E1 component subunit alpha [Alphaproteobacteria bacterium]|jgi:pyruvate dehydrogenase E1 component alpha subunit|nr:pyruvate dehydrogenase (acetyl-transferring) E1 component subunit alpha [Rhodospirillaceae bacterium]MDP6407637.1 thiamine pyrophosphate-dependent dehydrogenase E1 component subunit alpha [Alphaproteobacteria bacterium]MDP6622489.1 thiamine pyrophosphate-dependent dehydrogenase E1 component subunit alpha [Alphaproteobacteria bacterium]|tara:strand:+ start:465 stop:1433 length:969 start_codon:yes stop_codon:yes gene_type:complete